MADQIAEKGAINWIEGESQRVGKFATISLKTMMNFSEMDDRKFWACTQEHVRI